MIKNKSKNITFTLFLFFLIIAVSGQNIWAGIGTFIKGESEKKKNENENKATDLLEELLNDGTLTESESNSSFLNLIGEIADNVLTSIYRALTPSIAGLITTSNGIQEDGGFLDNDRLVRKIDSNSFLAKLIAFLLCIECLVLGIKSFITDDGSVFQKAISKLIVFAFTIAFLAFIPLIGKAIINIFTSMGNAVSSQYIQKSNNTDNIFYYMPSDVLDALYFCKNLLSIEKIRIGGYTLPTLIPHISINIGDLLISLPFLYILMMIIFWYTEMFIILISAYAIIPVCTLSELNISSIKNIVKALVLQGLKIFCGILIANMTTYIVMNSVKKLDGMINSTINLIIFCIFMVMIIFFLILKCPNAIVNAVNGDIGKSSDSLVPAALTAGASLIGSALGSRNKMQNAGKSLPENYSPTKKIDIPSISDKKAGNTNKNTKDNIEKIGSNNKKNTDSYGEVVARATKPRMEAAKAKLMNEGYENISENMIKDRAIRDAKIEKLSKMKEKNFMTDDGIFNKPAYEQYHRMINGKN